MALNIPAMSPTWPSVERESPITPRENLMLALEHKKPMWMPNLYADSQMVVCPSNHDGVPKDRDGYDWFGTYYSYSPTVGINMPAGGVFEEVTQWREKVKFPDLKAIDWSKDAEGFVRNEKKALYMRFGNGIFERLHAFEDFEQAMVDLITEPEECRALFEAIADYKIELFNCIRDVFPLDYIVAADDYGTARGPFFSTALYEATILEPTRRFVKAVQARGTKFIAHCCGKVDAFIPYLVEDLGVDGLEIQDINDIPNIMAKYGHKILLEYKADANIVHDDEASGETMKEHIRHIVDTFGAHAIGGSGVAMNLQSSFKDKYYLMEEELYSYSLSKYAQEEK
ncbi:MAG: hypothetical protein IKV79_02260 [Oscillospiraceae bacterium]|nr:hypothetical protein [Oscillospiraceae bacterium]